MGGFVFRVRLDESRSPATQMFVRAGGLHYEDVSPKLTKKHLAMRRRRGQFLTKHQSGNEQLQRQQHRPVQQFGD